tara:strand:- start:62 stop:1342 length:1281 start_codon:yes stop_codon:yes gene_type:complete
MAFKMNRSILKGTPLHKSIVAQTRTQADSTLVAAANRLGQSYMPAAVDFSIKRKSIKFASDDEDKGRDKSKDKKATKIPRINKLKKEEVKDDSDKKLEKAKPPEYTPPVIKGNEEDMVKIKPKKIKRLPTNEKKIELQKATKTTQTKKSTDKFFEAAKKAGIDIKTVADYEKAEKILVYDEKLNNWREKIGGVSDTSKEFKSTSNTDPVAATTTKTKEELAVEAQVKESTEKTIQKEKSRVQTQKENRLDKAIAEKNIKADQKETIRLEKQVEINKKNEAIRARNKAIADAKKYYNTDKINKTQLEAYNEMIKKREAEKEIEIPEEDDPEPELDEYNRIKALNSNTPKNQVTQKEVKPAKPLISDFEGNFFEKQKQYKEAMKAYKEKYDIKNGKSPTQMRDDRVYTNALKNGPVRKNMIEGGYKPQ